jgi:putative acetyltransferase
MTSRERMTIIIIIIRVCKVLSTFFRLISLVNTLMFKRFLWAKGATMSEIVVRHVTPEDAAALHRIYGQPDTQASTLHLPHSSLQMWQTRLATPQPHAHLLVACIDEEVVGQCALHVEERPRRRHVASLGMGVDERYRQRGVGTALMREMVALCDNWLQVSRMELTVFVDNGPAIALYQRFGFEIEGTAKSFAMRHGELIDAHYMARVKA